MKRTIEIEDSLQDCVENAVNEVKQALLNYLAENPDTDATPCLNNDLDYSGTIHEIVDSAVPVYKSEINDIFYLHGDKIAEAFDDADIGTKVNEGWPSGWKAAAIFCYIERQVAKWYHANADGIFEEWQKTQTKI